MKSSWLFSHIATSTCFFVLLLCSTTSIAATKLEPGETILAVQAFGDSFLDTGNNNHLISITKSDFPPYGVDFQGGKPTGRFSNARVMSDLTAKGLGVKGLLPSYSDPNLQSKDLETGLCFASGGAGYDLLSSKINRVIPLSIQLKFFKDYISKLRNVVGMERSQTIIANSLFLISGGNNDILFSYFGTSIRKLQYDVPTYTDLLATWASSFFKELYALGARKFAVLSTCPLGCLPFSRTIRGGLHRKCDKEMNNAVKLFNVKLSSVLDSLNHELTRSKFVYIDIYNPILDLVQQPNKFGYEISEKGCCGTGLVEAIVLCNKLSHICSNISAYVFFDSIHPTESAYKIIVSQIIKQLFH
ncbi:hypothetical protein UlMin_034043 [Ulmus minor]